MVILMIVLGVLLFLSIAAFFSTTKTRLLFSEKKAEVIDFIEVHNDFDKPEAVTGYRPVVRFEVDGKFYEGTGRHPYHRQNKKNKPTVVLYNPQNPAEFELKELSYSSGTGCLWVIFFLIALGVTVYFYIR